MADVAKRRLEWVDIFKGIVMLLVVIGHATGEFNTYIYQFHMAAFFFISGYLDTTEKKSWGQLIKGKFFSLYFPLLFFVFLSSILEYILNGLGYYTLLYEGEFGGILFNLKEFILRGNLYSQSLGACWFILTLCGTFLLQKLILTVCAGQKDKLYFGFAVSLFLLGSFLSANRTYMQLGPFPMDLVFRANFYFSVGALVRTLYKEKRVNAQRELLERTVLFVVNLSILILAGQYVGVWSWPSRAFPFFGLEALLALNGIVLIWNLSILLKKAPAFVEHLFTLIGKNTMGILVFHFYIFKICMAGLAAANLMPAEDVRAVVPKGEVSTRYWLLFTVLATIGSLVLWQICKKIPVVDFCVGTRRDLYNQIQLPHGKGVPVICSCKNVLHQGMTCYKQWFLKHQTGSCKILALCMVCIFVGIYYTKSGASTPKQFLKAAYYFQFLDYSDGWYTDGWCEPDLKIHCGARAPRKLLINGFYPGELDGDEIMEVYVDGELEQTLDVSSDQITIQVDLDAGLDHQVEIKSNFQMEQSGPDIRDLSFVLVNIQLAEGA